MTSPKIFRYCPCLLSSMQDYSTFDYVRGPDIRLQRKNTFVKGELQLVEFFDSATLNPDGTISYSDKIVQEEFVYTRDADGFALWRDMTISWYNEDDTVARTKQRKKYYEFVERLQEGKRRRSNNIDQIQIQTLGMIAATEAVSVETATAMGVAFMSAHETDTSLYIDTASPSLVAAIAADTTHTWLDNVIAPPSTTIRDYVLNELS